MAKIKPINDELNSLAYNDVLDCNGPSLPGNEEYMQCYRFWYPLGYEAKEDREWEIDMENERMEGLLP